MGKGRDEGNEIHVTDIEALKENTRAAVEGFAERWVSMPALSAQCEVMDVRQLRDAMGLRATIEYGDPWPAAERLLLQMGFRWHWLGSSRVMILRERDGYSGTSAGGGDGWDDGVEWDDVDA